jgi:hypothetical protein
LERFAGTLCLLRAAALVALVHPKLFAELSAAECLRRLWP